MKKKNKGFSGERILDLSKLKKKSFDKLNLSFSFSKIGYFPNATYQYAEGEGENSYILLYCVNGFGNVKIGERDFSVKVGEFIIIPKFTRYYYAASMKNPWSIYWCYFDGDGIADLLDFYTQHNKELKGYLEFTPERIHLFDIIYQNLKKGYDQHNLMFLNLCMLNFLSSLAFVTKAVDVDLQEDKSHEVVEHAIIYMKKNESRSITLAQLAQQANLSISHFSYIFKNKTGLSPIDYFNQIKIKKACTYLSHTNLLVKEIAYKLGITDAAYFSRVFTKVMGMSPHAYRHAAK